LDDYLSHAENRAENKDICSGYFRLLKCIVWMLKSFAITGEEYIKNQIQEDLTYEQMSLKEYIDPFTGSYDFVDYF
jgi:hypothetical protein